MYQLSIRLTSLKFAMYDVHLCWLLWKLWLAEYAANNLQLAAASIDTRWQTVELEHASSVHVTVDRSLLPTVFAVVVREWPASLSHDLSAKPWPTVGKHSCNCSHWSWELADCCLMTEVNKIDTFVFCINVLAMSFRESGSTDNLRHSSCYFPWGLCFFWL